MKNKTFSTMSQLNRNMGPYVVKATMDLSLASNLKYLFSQMKTLLWEVLNFTLMVRSTMVNKDMRWLNRGWECQTYLGSCPCSS